MASGIDSSITSVELILIFNDNASLPGGSTAIQGSRNLGTGADSAQVNFYPTATATSGAERIYDATFSGFNDLNPNNTWGLLLWDNSSSGIENGLVSRSLDITAVPEPVNIAVGIFGVALSTISLSRSLSRR